MISTSTILAGKCVKLKEQKMMQLCIGACWVAVPLQHELSRVFELHHGQTLLLTARISACTFSHRADALAYDRLMTCISQLLSENAGVKLLKKT